MPFKMSPSEKKGWFSPTLFMKNFTRFWPLVAGYGLCQLFLLPMEIITQAGYYYNDGTRASQWVADDILSASVWSVPMGAVFGLLAAMALFSYLMNARSAGMLHALPIRREGLFLTNWLSGLCFFTFPNAVVGLITLAVEGAVGGMRLGLTLRWFLLHTVIAMFFFCFAVCCAMFTGHILALPVFYGVLNGLAAGLCALVDNGVDILLVGYAGNSLTNSSLTRWCTPIWHLMDKVNDIWGDGEAYYVSSGTAIALGYCLVLGAAFTLIAVVAYQHRQLERAGDVVTVSWVRPIFQWGVGICTGLSVGTMLYHNFFRYMGPWAFVAAVVLCAVLGAFVARMFLKKTLRVFADGWVSCTAVGLAMLLLLGGAKADFFGYQKWVPDASKVMEVYLGSLQTAPYDDGRNGVTLTDPELVEEAVAIHTLLTQKLDRLEKTSRNGVVYATDQEGYETAGATGLRFQYDMADGSYESRWYSGVPITEADLADPGSYAARLQALLNRPEVQREAYLDRWEEREEVSAVGAWLNNHRGEDRNGELTESQAKKLWEAFLKDLDAGRIHRYLLDGRERAENCYYTDVNFTLVTYYDTGTGERDVRTDGLAVTLQKSATAMMEVLEQEGLTDLLLSRDTEKFPDTTEVVY